MKARWLGLVIITVLACGSLSARDKLNAEEREWLRMVDPIITAKERKAFRKKMKTHEDRRRFIRLFWAKRDPDLDDNVNPFRKEYLARYDYVLTHYETRRRPYQEFTRGSLFLLLGKPEIKRNFVDWSLLGPGYRNPFFEYPPELWIYKEPGFNYKRRQLKVQFIPVNSFGDYAAVTDRISDFWLRDLKNKLIEHPELDEPPVNVTEQDDYQYLATFAEKRKERQNMVVRGRKSKDKAGEKAATGTAATKPPPVDDPLEEARELGKPPEQRKVETREIEAGAISTTGTPGRTQAETVSLGDTVAVEELETP
ncbi:MAG: GWxTD domain-containing protein, partial [Acidobacteriota bacterium]|nr:GWxTD domain-containing protein [Acidobacteriota bacterium]